jgi:hypothetical protein
MQPLTFDFIASCPDACLPQSSTKKTLWIDAGKIIRQKG